ncbi:MAG: hypothetical protein JWO06_621 [Bacteroidota bacterium]|nr:hypothetical protein [Bacteroidota bacterium]
MKLTLRSFLEAEQESKTLFEPIELKELALLSSDSEFVLLPVGREF